MRQTSATAVAKRDKETAHVRGTDLKRVGTGPSTELLGCLLLRTSKPQINAWGVCIEILNSRQQGYTKKKKGHREEGQTKREPRARFRPIDSQILSEPRAIESTKGVATSVSVVQGRCMKRGVPKEGSHEFVFWVENRGRLEISLTGEYSLLRTHYV